MPLETLLGKAPQMLRRIERRTTAEAPLDLSGIDLAEACQRVLRMPVVADKSFLINIGDRTVGGLVARDQFVGPWQVPVSDVGVTALGFETFAGEAMAMGERAPVALLDAPASGRLAVAEALTNIAAASIADLATVRLSANWMAAAGSPGEDERLYDTVDAVSALCRELKIAIPVGKDSLSMQTRWTEAGVSHAVVAPVSLVVSAFAPVDDVRRTLTPQLVPDVAPACCSSTWAGAAIAWAPRCSHRPSIVAVDGRPISKMRASWPRCSPACRNSVPGNCCSPGTIAATAACSSPCARWLLPARRGSISRLALYAGMHCSASCLPRKPVPSCRCAIRISLQCRPSLRSMA